MAQRVIKPATSLIIESDDIQHRLPVDRPVVQYIRRSTGKQVKESVQSKIQQDEATERKLRARGFTDIKKISVDDGKSGQKRPDERIGVEELYRMIRHKEVGAVAFYDASRLWRDTTHVWYNDFIQLIQKYHVPVITFNQTYWPDSRNDMDKLREEFAHAAHQLRHFTDKVNPARLQAIELGQNYGGHSVPMGYVVVGVKGERHYAVYEPHAKLIRWLFKRYRELGGNLPRLGRELRSTSFKFPPFEGVPVPHVTLPFVDGSYVARTREALVSILSNPAYIGWYTFSVKEPNDAGKREVVRTWINKEAHDAIVPMDDFLYAHERLSSATLEGEPREEKPKTNRRYAPVNALLEGILEEDGHPAYAASHEKAYRVDVRAHGDKWIETTLRAPIKDIDTAFSEALIRLLATLELRHQQGLQDSLHEQLTRLQEEKHEQVVSFDVALANIEKAIRQAELDKRVALEEEYEPGVREATKQLKRLHADKAALEAKATQAGKEETELAECQDLLDCAINSWSSLTFEKQKRFVRLVVERANVTAVSPHILELRAKLKDPVNCTLVGYVYRQRGTKSDWTEEENAIIEKLYPHADRKEILEALPTRSWENIIKQAEGKVKRYTTLNTSLLPGNMTYADVALMRKMGYAFVEESRRFVSYGHESPWFVECDGVRTSIDQLPKYGVFSGLSS